MKKLVIIPAFNEEGNLEKTIKDIKDNAPDFDYVISMTVQPIKHLKCVGDMDLVILIFR